MPLLCVDGPDAAQGSEDMRIGLSDWTLKRGAIKLGKADGCAARWGRPEERDLSRSIGLNGDGLVRHRLVVDRNLGSFSATKQVAASRGVTLGRPSPASDMLDVGNRSNRWILSLSRSFRPQEGICVDNR